MLLPSSVLCGISRLWQGAKGLPANLNPQSCSYPLPFGVVCGIYRTFCRAPRGSRQISTRKVVPTLFRFVWYSQDFGRAPRGSRQISTRKVVPTLFRFVWYVVFTGLFAGRQGDPGKFRPQSCSYPLPFCVVFGGLWKGAKGTPSNFDL